MKIKTTTLLCILALSSTAQTSIPGGNVSGTWTVGNSPYLIQGSIQITNGSTLTIQPGVTVNFQGTYKLLVLGRLLAVGNVSDSIIFTADNTTNGWRSIRFDYTASSNDTSEIKYCKLLYGKATGSSPDDNGGALYFNNFSKAVVANCRIAFCEANSNGGGAYCNSANPRILNNIISNNASITGQGGGLYLSLSNSTISGNTISNNSVSGSSVNGYGGGIYCSGGNSLIDNNTISGNSASINGGGIYCTSGPTGIISNNIIDGNTTPGSGGGIYCAQGSDASITGNSITNNTANRGGGIVFGGNNNFSSVFYNTISNNTAQLSQGNDGTGGGIYCFETSPVISNNTITNNSVSTTPGYGGAVYCNNSSPQLINNTISNNTAFLGGALYCNNGSDPILQNTILWGNTALMAGAQLYSDDEPSDPDFNYCDVQGGTSAFVMNGNFYTGTYLNNIDADPFFVSPSAGSGTGYNGTTADWSLQNNSQCINSGDPFGIYNSTDKAGNPRVVNSVIDIGAYENQIITSVVESTYEEKLFAYPNPSVNGNFVITLNDILLSPIAIGILTMQGKQVLYKTLNEKAVEGGKIELQLNGLAAGTYLARVEMSNGKTAMVRLCIAY